MSYKKYQKDNNYFVKENKYSNALQLLKTSQNNRTTTRN